MKINTTLTPADLLPQVNCVLELACKKVRAIDKRWNPADGTPVFTVNGKYTTRGWTEWTQGFQYGSATLSFDGTDDRELLELGRSRTLERMAPHVTHMGVHDHGFNNISTYGNLRRLMREGRIDHNEWEMNFYEMALKASGAVQAARWSPAAPTPGSTDLLGYIYSFNGPHSLFIDTMRSLRSLAMAHHLGHMLCGENDRGISLLARLVMHGMTTAQYLVFPGCPSALGAAHGTGGRDVYDIRGRTAHEAIFNTNDGRFRCPGTQQGYSPFSTWTRGLAWAMLGFAEQAEYLNTLKSHDFVDALDWKVKHPRALAVGSFVSEACSTSDHYINNVSASDGIPYWDDGAPGLSQLDDWRDREAEPFNDHEPVDSSAAAIAAQGLIRLGMYLAPSRKGGAKSQREPKTPRGATGRRARSAPPYRDGASERYLAAGLTIAKTLFAEPYLSTSSKHEGLILHSIYHRPNGWDHIPKGRKIPCGESSMWGDYHAIELAVLIQRMARGDYMTFFDR